MNRKQIVDAIEEAKKDLNKGSNAHNMAQNRLTVLDLLIWRWDDGWYDEESDLNFVCDNIVEELIELESNFKRVKPKVEFVFR